MIAVGNSRKEKLWKNKEITWEEFLQRVGTTYRTSESCAEFKSMPKGKQDEIKDIGGFVGGRLKDGKRRKDRVEFRSMLTLDMDYADRGFWEALTMLFDYTCCIYSTHKHSAEKPRIRLVIPLARNISAEEYAAVSRRVAADMGIEQFDDTTYDPARLMYWPSTSSDGEFVFEKQQGKLLDPDEVLSRYKNWRDSTEWPVSSRQRTIVKSSLEKQADPLEKDGIIGAFCRAYSIQAAIEKFLPDIYRGSALGGRYDYIPADSTAGVIIYEDKFAYSHHATDPACGKLCNAFDLVRLHKFGHLDGDYAEESAVNKLTSFKAMQEFCASDDAVKKQLAEERKAMAKSDFEAVGEDWQKGIIVNNKGQIADTLSNIAYIMRHDEQLKGIAYNQHRD